MSLPVTVPAPTWREVPSLGPFAVGYHRAHRGADRTRFEVLICEPARLSYYRQLDDIPLVATDEAELAFLIALVDFDTAALLRRVWMWRAEKLLELAERARSYIDRRALLTAPTAPRA